MPRIAVIPGDGIGVDVTREAVKILELAEDIFSLSLELEHFDFGADHYLKTGVALPDGTLDRFQSEFDAIFLGALGDPRVPDMAHAKDILLGTRFGLDLYVNHRPVKLLDDRLTLLRGKTTEDIDFVIFRENTEGLYVGAGGFLKQGTSDEIAIQESINTRKGVERIIRYSFEFAKQHSVRRVTMSDKSNVLRFEGDLWQRVFGEVGENYPEIEKQHLYVDALVMQMVKRPEQFEVIVTCNMFGDIVTDLGAQIQGGMGMAGSGNINPETHFGLFEPVHGSAPKYAGKNIANPIAAVLSAQMMLEFLGFKEAADRIELAVRRAVTNGETPRDIGGTLGTSEVGDALCQNLKDLS